MAHVVIATSGLVGILNSGFEIARRLNDAGHEVSFLGWRDVADSVEANGYRFVRVDGDRRALDQLAATAGTAPRLRSLLAGRRLRRELVGSTEIEDALRSLRPDLLIIDIEFHTATIASRSLGVPTIIRFEWFSIFRTWDVPPMHLDLPLRTDVAGRLRAAIEWARVLAARAAKMTVGRITPGGIRRRIRPFAYGTLVRSDLAQFAKARGVRLGAISSWTHWLNPHLYPDLPSMTTTASEMDFGRGMPPGHHYIGPMIRPSRLESRVPAADLERWDAFRAEQRDAGRPIVYCAVGTLAPDTLAMVKQVIDACGDRAERALVVGLGGTATVEQLGPIPPNVLVMDYAPQVQILRDASVAVIHGGINTINECISAGVPMVVHRGGLVDQPGCARRVEHHGLGVRADLLADEPAAIAAHLERVTTDTGFAERVAAMRANFAAYATGRVLETIVEQALSDEGARGG